MHYYVIKLSSIFVFQSRCWVSVSNKWKVLNVELCECLINAGHYIINLLLSFSWGWKSWSEWCLVFHTNNLWLFLCMSDLSKWIAMMGKITVIHSQNTSVINLLEYKIWLKTVMIITMLILCLLSLICLNFSDCNYIFETYLCIFDVCESLIFVGILISVINYYFPSVLIRAHLYVICCTELFFQHKSILYD